MCQCRSNVVTARARKAHQSAAWQRSTPGHRGVLVLRGAQLLEPLHQAVARLLQTQSRKKHWALIHSAESGLMLHLIAAGCVRSPSPTCGLTSTAATSTDKAKKHTACYHNHVPHSPSKHCLLPAAHPHGVGGLLEHARKPPAALAGHRCATQAATADTKRDVLGHELRHLQQRSTARLAHAGAGPHAPRA